MVRKRSSGSVEKIYSTNVSRVSVVKISTTNQVIVRNGQNLFTCTVRICLLWSTSLFVFEGGIVGANGGSGWGVARAARPNLRLWSRGVETQLSSVSESESCSSLALLSLDCWWRSRSTLEFCCVDHIRYFQIYTFMNILLTFLIIL